MGVPCSHLIILNNFGNGWLFCSCCAIFPNIGSKERPISLETITFKTFVKESRGDLLSLLRTMKNPQAWSRLNNRLVIYEDQHEWHMRNKYLRRIFIIWLRPLSQLLNAMGEVDESWQHGTLVPAAYFQHSPRSLRFLSPKAGTMLSLHVMVLLFRLGLNVNI